MLDLSDLSGFVLGIVLLYKSLNKSLNRPLINQGVARSTKAQPGPLASNRGIPDLLTGLECAQGCREPLGTDRFPFDPASVVKKFFAPVRATAANRTVYNYVHFQAEPLQTVPS